MKPYRVEEFVKLKIPRPRHGHKWGHWRLNTKTYVLEFRNGYEVDLESCTTAAEILDWILQITRKSWTTAEDIGNLIRALGEIAPGGCFGLQGLVCPLGVPPNKPKPHVDFKKIIQKGGKHD